MRRTRTAPVLLAAVLAVRCGAKEPRPSALDTRNDACAFCRMPVSDPKLAAQLGASGEETKFFDDIGCLREYISAAKALPPRSTAWVADHETGFWVGASSALYERCPSVETPMGSHLIAHARVGPRRAPGAGCEPVAASAILGSALTGQGAER